MKMNLEIEKNTVSSFIQTVQVNYLLLKICLTLQKDKYDFAKVLKQIEMVQE